MCMWCVGAWVHFKIFYAAPTLLNHPFWLCLFSGMACRRGRWPAFASKNSCQGLKCRLEVTWPVNDVCGNNVIMAIYVLLGAPGSQEPSAQHPSTAVMTGIDKGILVRSIYWFVGPSLANLASCSGCGPIKQQVPLGEVLLNGYFVQLYPWVKCRRTVSLYSFTRSTPFDTTGCL